MNEHARIISQNLKRLAYEAGKSQVEIANDLNINKSTLSCWMNGVRIPKMSSIDMLCRYFGVKRSDIMDEYTSDKKKDAVYPVYYKDEETAKAAQEVFDDPDLRMLFSAARNAKPQDIKLAADMLRRFKETNPDG